MNTSCKNWVIKKISEIADVVGGGTPSTKNPSNFIGDVPWITPRDLSGNKDRFVSFGERNISSAGLSSSNAKLLPKGAILLSSRAPVGYLAVAKKELTTNQGFQNLVVNNDNFNIFVYYLLKDNIEVLKNNASGSTFIELSSKTLKSLEFLFPPLNEQQKIAEILSSLDDKIELNQKINDNLEKIASSLFKRWFVDFEFPSEDGKPYKTSGGKMINSELGEIPYGWDIYEAVKLLDFIKGVEPGSKKYSEEKLTNYEEFFRVGDIYNGVSSKIFVDSSFLKNTNVKFDDILITTDGTVGRVATGLNGVYSGGIRKVVSKRESINNSFIYFWLKSEYVQNILQEYASDSTTIAHASGAIRDMKIVFNDKIFSKFSLMTENIFNNILNNLKEIKNLEIVRDSLLPKLMNGKIKVR